MPAIVNTEKSLNALRNATVYSPVVLQKLAGLIRQVFNRSSDFRLELLQRMPNGAVCAEIGVWKGEFSSRILELTSPSMLHLIDPWEFQSDFSDRMYGGTVAKNQEDMDSIYSSVKRKFNSFDNVILNRGKSEKILQQFPDQYFDWVYIDGNHFYEFVLNDLRLSLSKVKPTGFISGDDYNWGRKYGFPVRNAVNDFLHENALDNKLEIIGSQFIISL
jgi:hypothetical protein